MATGDPRGVVFRARQLLREKRYADVLQVCNDELARGTDDPELRLVAAQSLMAQGRHEGAKKEAQQVVRLDSTHADAHRILAEVAMARGEHEAAGEHLARVLELDPDDERSAKLLESLRPGSTSGSMSISGPASSISGPSPAPGFDDPMTRPVPKVLERELLARTPREESGPLELSADDLEEEDSEEESGESDEAAHVDPFSGESFHVSSSGEALAVTDSMMEELPRPPGPTLPAPRGLRTLHDHDAPRVTPRPEPAQPVRSTGPMTPSPARLPPPSGLARTPSPSPVRTPPPSADEWRPPPGAMDTGAGAAPKYEGTLRLPALGELPEEEEAPTMPLLRPSGPPQPQLRLDPLAARPVTHEQAGERQLRPTGPQAPEPAPLELAPAVAAPRSLGGDAGSEFEEFGVEPASVPLPPRAEQPIPRETLDPLKARAELARGRRETPRSEDAAAAAAGDDIFGMFTGKAPRADPGFPQRPLGREDRDPSLPEHTPQPERERGRTGGSSGKLAALGALDDSSDVAPRPLTPEELERQLAAASRTVPVELREGRRRKSKGGAGRWVLVALLGTLLGGGGLYGYFWYRSYKYVKAEWKALRDAVHLSTPEGYRLAASAADRILKHKKQDPDAAAALGMCDAAMSVEFGEDRIKGAKEHLERAKRTDSEWRTAASAFLALTDDPASAEGYLRKAIEVYPESALLAYLRGRALAASDASEKATESYGAALKLVPRYVAAQIALAVLRGQQAAGYAEALRALDEILGASGDNVQALIERARLRARHAKELEVATADAKRVVGELSAKAGRGQLGWAHIVLAQVAWLAKLPASMSTELDEAAKSPPCCDSAFRYELAGELMKLHRMADAEKQIEAALKLKPKQPEYVQRQARVLLELDDPAAAAAALQNAPERHPETRLLAGRVAFAQASYEKAAKLLREVAAESKDSLEAALALALARARLGESADAIAALDKLAGAHPQEPDVFKALGTVQLWSRDHVKAEAALRRAWKLTKLDPAVPTLLGEVSLRQHDVARAASRFERALAGRPDYRRARIGLARVLATTGKLGEARAEAAKIGESDRKKHDVHALAAELDLADGKLDAAKGAIAEAEAAGAPPFVVARLAGELALARKDGKGAVAELKKASKLARGKEADVLALLGRAQLVAREVDDAYDTFHLALKEDPGHPSALLELGRIAIKDGEHAVAVKRLNDALARIKERKLPARMTATAHAALGQAYLRQKDTGRAITNLQDAIDLDPTAAEPQYLMGQTYDKLDRPQRAVAHYLKALQLDPSLTEGYELLGRAYAKMGDTKNALKFYEDYLRTNPPAVKAREVGREVKKLQAAAEGQ